jgi:hypothetical protein
MSIRKAKDLGELQENGRYEVDVGGNQRADSMGCQGVEPRGTAVASAVLLQNCYVASSTHTHLVAETRTAQRAARLRSVLIM